MSKMGINMIEMYCKLVKEQFEPITSTLNARDMVLREKCEVQAKKDLGVYDKMVKLAKLKLQVEELELELKGYTTSYYAGGKHHNSKVDQITNQYLKKARNGFHLEVQKAMDDMIFKIKLSGLEGDTKKVFEDLPNVVKKFTEKLEKLPKPMKIKRLK